MTVQFFEKRLGKGRRGGKGRQFDGRGPSPVQFKQGTPGEGKGFGIAERVLVFLRQRIERRPLIRGKAPPKRRDPLLLIHIHTCRKES